MKATKSYINKNWIGEGLGLHLGGVWGGIWSLLGPPGEFWRFWVGLGMDFRRFFRGFLVIISKCAILRKLAFRLDGSMIFKVSSF